MNRIVHTFWTKPMKKTYQTLRMAYASAKSIKAQGYELVAYTDAAGAKLLEDFPYDDVIVLEELEDVNPCMFAAVKFLALEKEPLGSIHVDYDVMIDRPCLSWESGRDVFVQCVGEKAEYRKEREFISRHGVPESMKDMELSVYPYWCGVVGFNSQDLKDAHIKVYREAMDLYKDVDVPSDITLDYVFEQGVLTTLAEQGGYVAQFIDTCDIEACEHYLLIEGGRYYRTSGFTHYQNRSKYARQVQEAINARLTREDMKIINRNYIRREYE